MYQALSIVWKSIKVSLTTPVVFLHNPNPDAGGTTRFCAIKYTNCGVFIYLYKFKFYLKIEKKIHEFLFQNTLVSISSGQRNFMKTYLNEANICGITKIALKIVLDFFGQRRWSYKIANFWLSKSFFYVKNCLNLSKKNLIGEYQSRTPTFVINIFW